MVGRIRDLDLAPERELVSIRADKTLILARKAIRRLIEAESRQGV